MLQLRASALAVADGEARNNVWLAEQGLDLLSIGSLPNTQAKGRELARERDVGLRFEQAEVHAWPYPEGACDVVVATFTRVRTPAERA